MIAIVPYDPAWPQRFGAERERLRARLGPVALLIEHNGSTSVPGLAAKPVIDIQISVAALHPMDVYRAPLLELGYTHRPHEDDAFSPYFHLSDQKPHTFHVHVVRAGGDEEARTLAFRDYLADHPTALDEYAALKRTLAMQFGIQGEDRYASSKSDFIERTIAIALSQGYPHPRARLLP